ncbi:SDR family NAD(P)-dependent oxidoreductase [Halovenus halobia]|uniref:SDR family NAD(P)-dependent oxidoreductase n=1 Tax=Halovenus halobia TaxID=3396622 RepID=UPI003F57F806
MTERAIVIGASSGIGEALARKLAAEGYEVGLTARSVDKLETIAEALPTRSYVAEMDIADTETARETFTDLTAEMGTVDVVVVNAGVGPENIDLDWKPERDTIDVNVRGFTAMSVAAMNFFEEQGHGQLVGVSSVASYVGSSRIPSYYASKAYVSNYLDGLRYKARHLDADITVTTVEPGFVDTDLAGGEFWMCSPETAAELIHEAIAEKKRQQFVTKRWRLVALALTLLPDLLKRRLF